MKTLYNKTMYTSKDLKSTLHLKRENILRKGKIALYRLSKNDYKNE